MAVSGHVCVAFTTEDTLTPKTTHREGRKEPTQARQACRSLRPQQTSNMAPKKSLALNHALYSDSLPDSIPHSVFPASQPLPKALG